MNHLTNFNGLLLGFAIALIIWVIAAKMWASL